MVIFPDVELVLTQYLRAALTARGETVLVTTTYRDAPKVVWLRRDGGPRVDQVREVARVGVNVYAAGATDQAVSDLTRLVRALLGAAANGAPIVAAREVSGPVPIPDSMPRRFCTFEFTVRGADLI